MATAQSTIYIGGAKLLPYKVSVEQHSNWHHRFEITVATEKAKVTGGAATAPVSLTIENAIAYAGEEAEITIERPNGTFNFKGFVTDVHLDQTYAGDSFIIFKGWSPTYLLEGHKSVASFEKKSLKDIFTAVTSDFPGNVSKEVKPAYKKPIPFVVRYKETQYQFLSRLAMQYGEWFYYDGQKLVFGELPSKNPEVNLTFGSDSMLSFNYGINLRPSAFKQQFYKYQDNAVVEHSAKSFKPGWLDPHSKSSHKASQDLFKEEALDPILQDVEDKNHIKYLAEAKKSSIVGEVMVFTGQSANPGITVGAEIEVNSRNGFIGKYRIIWAAHTFTGNRDYYNMFRAIPVTTASPPMNRRVVLPEAEPQVGIVKENNDPDKLGRVRVQLKWQQGTEMTPWIRVLTNHAGEDRGEGIYGTYFIPEIGDEVFLEFEQGNPDRPYMVGNKYHGKIPPEFADPDNNFKAIKTRSGHILKFDDKDGEESITIIDKNNNQIVLNTKEESITISAPKKILIESEEIEMNGKNISITASEELKENGDNVTIGAKSNLKLSGDMGAEMVSNQKVDISGKTGVAVVSDVTTEVGGNATLKLKSSGIASLQGSLVKIN